VNWLESILSFDNSYRISTAYAEIGESLILRGLVASDDLNNVIGEIYRTYSAPTIELHRLRMKDAAIVRARTPVEAPVRRRARRLWWQRGRPGPVAACRRGAGNSRHDWNETQPDAAGSGP